MILDSLPQPSHRRIAIHVKPTTEHALRQGHPWVFDQSIRKQSHEGQAGDLAVIFDSKRRFLAIGLYDPDSPIRVRVLQHRQQATIDRSWFTKQIEAASAIRSPLEAQQTNGYRLIHGENDRLPGLIVDRYAQTLVLKLYTAAWIPHLRDIIHGLQTVQPFDRLVLRSSRNIQASIKPFGLFDGQTLIGDEPTAPIVFEENGLKFAADVVHGHKTGFFFDQRENRATVRDLSSGRQVLDVFSYSGGFTVYAAAGGATTVTSLDVSAPAMDTTQANLALNQALQSVQHIPLIDDAFAGLERLGDQGQRFDLVIVDPPSFAKKSNEVERALAAYSRLAQLALQVLHDDGVLVMASCSSQVQPDAFFNVVTRTITSSRRSYTEIARTSHALDHPIGFPEGEYLKCLFATITR